MIGYGQLVVVVFVAWFTGAASRPACPSRWPASTQERGKNDDCHKRALFSLRIHDVHHGYEPGRTYVVSVRARNAVQPFLDVILISDASYRAAACGGMGIFALNSSYLHQPSHCPHMVTTNIKDEMIKAKFRWTAPACGCITIRATVFSVHDEYYIDDDDVTDGHLTKTICPVKDGHHPPKHVDSELISGSRQGQNIPKAAVPNSIKENQHDSDNIAKHLKLSRSDKIDLLCIITQKYQTDALALTPSFLIRRRDPSSSRLHLEIALEQRRHDMMICCVKTGENRMHCVDGIRQKRIDRFCGNGIPDLPFTTTRKKWMMRRHDECCFILGVARYDCFNQTTTQKTSDSTVLPDFYYDESDPANDIEDYPTEINELTKPEDKVTETKEIVKIFKETVSVIIPETDKTQGKESHKYAINKPVDSDWYKDKNQKEGNAGKTDDITYAENVDMVPYMGKSQKQNDAVSSWRSDCCRAGERVSSLPVIRSSRRSCQSAATGYLAQVDFIIDVPACSQLFVMCCVNDRSQLEKHTTSSSSTRTKTKESGSIARQWKESGLVATQRKESGPVATQRYGKSMKPIPSSVDSNDQPSKDKESTNTQRGSRRRRHRKRTAAKDRTQRIKQSQTQFLRD